MHLYNDMLIVDTFMVLRTFNLWLYLTIVDNRALLNKLPQADKYFTRTGVFLYSNMKYQFNTV